jgi:hypothetical protein
MEDADDAVLSAGPVYHDALGNISPRDLMLQTPALARFLQGSSPRRALSYCPPKVGDPVPYRWYFVTAHARGCDALFRLVADSERFGTLNPQVAGYVFMECRQLERVMHGVVRLAVSMTTGAVPCMFDGVPTVTVEPARRGPAACLRCIQHHAWGVSFAIRTRPCRCSSRTAAQRSSDARAATSPPLARSQTALVEQGSRHLETQYWRGSAQC